MLVDKCWHYLFVNILYVCLSVHYSKIPVFFLFMSVCLFSLCSSLSITPSVFFSVSVFLSLSLPLYISFCLSLSFSSVLSYFLYISFFEHVVAWYPLSKCKLLLKLSCLKELKGKEEVFLANPTHEKWYFVFYCAMMWHFSVIDLFHIEGF